MAITVNNLQTQRYTNNASSYTLEDYAVAAGSNRVLRVRVGAMRGSESDFTLTVTFNGGSLLEAATTTQSGSSRWWRSSIFYLVAPAETTADVVVTSSSGLVGAFIVVETLHGAAQTSLIGATDTDAVVSATDVAMTLLGCSSNSNLTAVTCSNSGGPPTWSWTGATEDFELAHGSSDTAEIAGSGASVGTAGGDVTITGIRSGGQNQAAAAAEFKAAAVGGTSVPVFIHYYKQLAG